ncbi:MAG: hypothetical protein A2437_01295 [Bacteroidetes bacterium RIFOXYC2_FULL_40_12]|nr:MAG: hypothetical protein A2437_01295 [Bacteroidetes bacterium RIFOXYC2_FULL_40_12]
MTLNTECRRPVERYLSNSVKNVAVKKNILKYKQKWNLGFIIFWLTQSSGWLYLLPLRRSIQSFRKSKNHLPVLVAVEVVPQNVN